jgi:hypothetical protein
MRNSLLRNLIGFGLVLAAAVTLCAQALTVKDIIRLKRLGFSDAEVKAEVVKAGFPIAVTPADVQALRDAGAGDELIQALQAPVPKPLSLPEIVSMVKERQSIDQILDALLASGSKYAVSVAETSDLIRQGVPTPVLLALKGKALGIKELKLLGENHLPEGAYLKLEKLVGFEKLDLTAGDALALDGAGVPETIVARLRQEVPKKTAPPQIEPEDKDHPKELVGTWQGEVTGTYGEFGTVQVIFGADGRYILNTGMGAYQRGKWAAEQNVLILTPEYGISEAENFELNGTRLKIISKFGTITVTKVR